MVSIDRNDLHEFQRVHKGFFQTPESITDFLKGFGLVLVFVALVRQVRDRRDKRMEHMRSNEQ